MSKEFFCFSGKERSFNHKAIVDIQNKEFNPEVLPIAFQLSSTELNSTI